MIDPIRVVIIDDDYEDFLLTKGILSEIPFGQYQVTWIGTVDEALAEIRKQDADIYLLDYNLGSKSGLDILDDLKDIEMTIPIILLTGQKDIKVDMMAMEKGAADFISKSDLTGPLLERSIRYAIKRTRDSNQLKENKKLKVAKEAAELANEMKSQFVAHVSHEIRSPLGAIIGFTDLALKNCDDPAKAREFLRIVKRNSEELLHLVNDVLDVTKIESGHINIVSEDFKWTAVISDVVALLDRKAQKKDIQLLVDLDLALGESLRNDSFRLKQILINLIENAIKFTDHGYIRLHCSMEVLRTGGLCLTISVEDSGIGMTEEEKEKIFQPFGQANNAIVRKYGGTGLGLELSKKLAIAMGGDLILNRTAPREGSTFTLRLPNREDAVNLSLTL